MNGLLGYPNSGPLGLGLVVPQSDEATETTLWRVIDGQLAEELEDKKKTYAKQAKRATDLIKEAAKLPEPQRSEALNLQQSAIRLLDKQKEMLNGTVAKYNELAGEVNFYSVGLIEPKPVSTLGIVPVAVAGGVVAALAGLFLVVELTKTVVRGIAVANGLEIQTEGVLDQFANLIKEGGGFVREYSGLLKNAAIFGIVAIGGYALWKFSGGPRRGVSSVSRAMRALPAPKIEMKTAEGMVIA